MCWWILVGGSVVVVDIVEMVVVFVSFACE